MTDEPGKKQQYYKVLVQDEIHWNHTGERATSFALPSFWLYKLLPEHLVPNALCTAYIICQTYTLWAFLQATFLFPIHFFSTFMCYTHNPILSLHCETRTRVPDAETKLTAAQTRFPNEQLNMQKNSRLWYNQSSTNHDSVEAALWQV